MSDFEVTFEVRLRDEETARSLAEGIRAVARGKAAPEEVFPGAPEGSLPPADEWQYDASKVSQSGELCRFVLNCFGDLDTFFEWCGETYATELLVSSIFTGADGAPALHAWREGRPVSTDVTPEVFFGHPEELPFPLDRRNGIGMTWLHEAAEAANAHVVRRLLAMGLDVDARDHSGRTPLSWAAGGDLADTDRGLECLDALLAAGADINSVSKQPWTPMGAALALRRPRAAEHLRQRGGRPRPPWIRQAAERLRRGFNRLRRRSRFS